jgi:hypothetical protein
MDAKKAYSRAGILRIGKLDTLAGVRQELTRIYRASRRGELNTQDLTRFAFVLQAIARVIAQSDIEARMADLEHRVELTQENHTPHEFGNSTLPH